LGYFIPKLCIDSVFFKHLVTLSSAQSAFLTTSVSNSGFNDFFAQVFRHNFDRYNSSAAPSGGNIARLPESKFSNQKSKFG
jgi:hypothetical protein